MASSSMRSARRRRATPETSSTSSSPRGAPPSSSPSESSMTSWVRSGRERLRVAGRGSEEEEGWEEEGSPTNSSSPSPHRSITAWLQEPITKVTEQVAQTSLGFGDGNDERPVENKRKRHCHCQLHTSF